ncbi:hypothetical protein [Polaromonas sp. CG9_12]|nr:hypothetical protein [Polaromonas sp. CG9_12]
MQGLPSGFFVRFCEASYFRCPVCASALALRIPHEPSFHA